MAGEPLMPLGDKDPLRDLDNIHQTGDRHCVGFTAFDGGVDGSRLLLVAC